MLWRTWSLLAGLPVGALAAWAVAPTPTPAILLGCAVAAGVALAALTAVLAGAGGSPGRREAPFARAASVGFAAVPALAACLLGLPPGPIWWVSGVLAWLVIALIRARRRPAAEANPWLAAGFALSAGGGAIFVAAIAGAWLAEPATVFNPARADAVLEMDAGVVTIALPRCEREPARVELLADRGAHPKLGPDGSTLWFDAPGPGGRRQVHRLDLASGGPPRCWTCDEPGNNVRPYPGDDGAVFVFETDRHASWSDPTNTEIHLMRARGDEPRYRSRRLTDSAGPDDHAILGPGSRILVWSRRDAGLYSVVSASIKTAHGGTLLGPSGLIAWGGLSWMAPVAWSRDARSLVLVRGNPFGPLSAEVVDLATGDRLAVADSAAGVASFNADGGWLALSFARRESRLGRLPAAFGAALGPLATHRGRDEPLLAHTFVRVGPPRDRGELLDLDRDDVSAWGAPTGLSLGPHGRELVLGQRRRAGERVEERLLRVSLTCDAAPST